MRDTDRCPPPDEFEAIGRVADRVLSKVNSKSAPLSGHILDAVGAGCDTAQAIRGFMLARGIDRCTGSIASCAGYLKEQGRLRIEGNGSNANQRKYLPKV